MSATRLLVLGVVRMYGKAHGYQVRRELLAWSADRWAKVQPGSIYHALKKMDAEGLLEQVESEPGGGPGRIAYRITETGEADFELNLHKMLCEVREDPSSDYSFAAAITFLPALARERAVSLLDYRLTQLDGQRANATAILEHGGQWGQPKHVEALYRLWLVRVEADIAWTHDLIERLRAGEYVMADDEQPSFGAPGGCDPVVIKLD